MIKNFATIMKVYGFHPKYLILPIYRPLYRGFTGLTLRLDHLFYPDLRKQSLANPVFIIGHPRSGTTFLHRFLEKNCQDLRGWQAWEMLFPALTARKLMHRLVPRMEERGFGQIYDRAIHKTGPRAVEVDDAALFIRFFDGLFNWIYFDAWKNEKDTLQAESDLIKMAAQPYLLDYIKAAYKRNRYHHPQRMLSKAFSYLVIYDQIKKAFPDGKFIWLLRDPMQTIPSSMSLVRSAQSGLHNFEQVPTDKKMAYFQQLYKASLIFYQKFHELHTQGLDENQNLLVTYPQLRYQFDTTIKRIQQFAHIAPTNQLQNAIEEQLNKQQDYKSKHHYSLEEFGLEEATIKKDFAFIYEHYLIK